MKTTELWMGKPGKYAFSIKSKVLRVSYILMSTGCTQVKKLKENRHSPWKKSWATRITLPRGINRTTRLRDRNHSGRGSSVSFILLPPTHPEKHPIKTCVQGHFTSMQRERVWVNTKVGLKVTNKPTTRCKHTKSWILMGLLNRRGEVSPEGR